VSAAVVALALVAQEDLWLVSGMNRLRYAYLEIAPELEPYFVTGHHDDQRGIYETYGPGTEPRLYRVLGSTSTVVGVINAALAGAIGGLIARSAGAGFGLSLFVGAVVTLMVGVLLVYAEQRIVERGRGLVHPRFPR
jgi:hypothetical protein